MGLLQNRSRSEARLYPMMTSPPDFSGGQSCKQIARRDPRCAGKSLHTCRRSAARHGSRALSQAAAAPAEKVEGGADSNKDEQQQSNDKSQQGGQIAPPVDLDGFFDDMAKL